MNQQKTAFTIVELVVVITILSVLSTISFLSYTHSVSDARNSARLSDMSNIKMALKNHKFKNGLYPLPGNSIDITNQSLIIKQGYLNDDVYTQELIKKPLDPLTIKPYLYSVSKNRIILQLAMSMEDETLNNMTQMSAYVDGDYQQIADFLPSIVFATSLGGDIETLSKTTIVDKGTLNLPYDDKGIVVNSATTIQEVLSETGILIPKYYGYSTCNEIYENGFQMGSGTYKIMQSDGNITATGCTMIY